jgi:hypothetical protein
METGILEKNSILRALYWKKMPIKRGFWRFFYKKNIFLKKNPPG